MCLSSTHRSGKGIKAHGPVRLVSGKDCITLHLYLVAGDGMTGTPQKGRWLPPYQAGVTSGVMAATPMAKVIHSVSLQNCLAILQ